MPRSLPRTPSSQARALERLAVTGHELDGGAGVRRRRSAGTLREGQQAQPLYRRNGARRQCLCLCHEGAQGLARGRSLLDRSGRSGAPPERQCHDERGCKDESLRLDRTVRMFRLPPKIGFNPAADLRAHILCASVPSRTERCKQRSGEIRAPGAKRGAISPGNEPAGRATYATRDEGTLLDCLAVTLTSAKGGRCRGSG